MKNKFFKIICCMFLFAFLLPVLSGCQSTNKEESYLNTEWVECAECEYFTNVNQTKITWETTLTNNTIYNMKGFSIKFDMFSGNDFVKREAFNYSAFVKNGEWRDGEFYFYIEGNVDRIEFYSWSAEYDNLWNTYKIWFIVAIILVIVISIIHLIRMIVEDYDISDFIEDNLWIFYSIMFVLIVNIYFIFTSWVIGLIVIGAVISYIVLVLIMHLIQYFE